jgi:PAS domain S-box-containing protein
MAIDHKLVLDALAGAVIAADEQGHIVYSNEAASVLLDRSRAELSGASLQSILCTSEAADDLVGREVRVRIERRVGPARHVEVKLTRASALYAASLRDVSETALLEASVRTLTEVEEHLLREQRALAQSEARARRLQDSGVIGVVFWTRDGVLIDANDSFLRMIGYTREELASGKVRWPDITPPEFAHLDEQAMRELDEYGISQPFEKEYWHKDGHRVPILLGVATWEGTKDEGVAWILDISERRRLERQREEALGALAKSQSQLQAVLDNAPTVVFLKDLEGRYILVNRTAAALVGQTPEALVGLTDFDLFPAEVAERFRKDDQRVIERRAPIELEEVLPTSNGPRVAHTVKFPVRGAEGVVLATGGISIDMTERTELENALRQQHRVQETITANASAALFLLDADNHCTFMNPAAVAMTGYTLDVLTGRSVHETVHHHRPDGTPYPISECPLHRALQENRQTRGEEIMIRRDGSFFPVAFTASPIVEGGKPFGTVLEIRDVTEEKRAADELVLQGRILHSMAEGVNVADSTGIITYTNPAEDYMFGYERGELIGKHVTVLNQYPPEENVRIVSEVIDTLLAHGVWIGEWKNVRKDGSPFITRARITTLEQSGRPHFLCVQSDVTKERRDRDAAEFLASVSTALAPSLDLETTLERVTRLVVPKQAEQFAVYLESGAGPVELVSVAHVDPPRAELLWNLHARHPLVPELSGAVALEQGRHGVLVPIVTDEILAQVAENDEHLAALKELGLGSYVAVPLVGHGRVIGALSLNRSPSRERFDELDVVMAEELARRLAVAIDNARLFELTQRERRRAEEANRAKDELLSVTSHELRTPLNAILGWSRMLLSGNLDVTKQRRALETIERNAKIQVQLVDDILDVSSVITGKLRLTVAPVDPVPIVEAAVDVVRPAAEAKGVCLDISLDRSAGVVNGDAGRLQQVFWNLLSNAVKFTPRGGQVELQVGRRDGYFEVVVKDSGQGIEPGFLPHVFQPFRQQDASVTRVHGGLGLGLAIVKYVVELHGGQIEAISEGLGRGATFIVKIPVAASARTARPRRSDPPIVAVQPSAPLECPPELHGLHVLVAEDEPDARELVVAVLERCEMQVTCAETVSQALHLFREHPPDVLLSDIGMAGESGYDLIRRVRALPPQSGGAVPALALTAYASAADKQRALTAGFTAHTGKPADPQELVRLLVELCARRDTPSSPPHSK